MKIQLGVLIIIGLLIYFIFYYPATASVFNINVDGGTTKETSTNYVTETEQQNLCELFQPYIVAGDLAVQCDLKGGLWVCNEDRVGCYDALPDTIDCSGGGAFYSAYYQCQVVGAIPYCDGENLRCEY